MIIRVLMAIPFTLVLLVGCQKAPEKTALHPLDAFNERNDDPIAAAADRYQRRLSADGTVPDGALMRAKEERDAMLQGQTDNLVPSAWPVTWEWVGPGNIGGRLRPIVIHPTNPDIIYVGSASGGIWKTVDGGANWFVLDDFLPSLSVGDMVMHPEDFNTLFAGTGEGFFETVEGTSNTAAVRGAGIFVSSDAGLKWNQIPSTNNSDFYFVNRIEFDPMDSSTLLVTTNSGIWRSTDLGLNWSLREPFHALDIKYDPNDPMKVVAGGHDTEDGPYYSTDGGLTWQLANGAGGERQEIAWAPSQPNTVYAAVSNNGRIKVWRSTDGGQNYTLQTSGSGIQTWAGYNNTIWVDPTNADFVIVGGVRFYRSTNAGVNFSQRFGAVHPDMHRVVPHPAFDGVTNTTLYFATDGGIWRTDDAYGSNAVSLNNNLGVTQFYGGAINPTTGHIIGGTQDNGTLFYSGDPQDWDHIFGGDGGYAAADPTDPNYFYGEVQRALLHRSTNGGGSSNYIYSGPNPIQDAGSLSTNFIPFFTLDPNEPNRMLVACERMWRSNNVKASQPDWFSMKESIEPPGRGKPSKPSSHFDPNSPYNLSTIAVAPGNSDVIWAAHNNGDLYFTTNGTVISPNWTRVDENGVGLPDRWISTVVIDANDHDHVYVALMGWEGDNLWETTDRGDTWSDISGIGPMAIPTAPISAFALHRNLPGRLFVGTDVGVFNSDDNGLTWSTQSVGPGTVPVEQLLWKDDNTLLAVTHGRGMFLAIENAIFPEDLDVLMGRQTSGQLSDVFTSNDEYLRFRPGALVDRDEIADAILGRVQAIEVVIESTSSSASPTVFQFRLQSRLNGGKLGEVEQKIRLWNYDSGEYETFDIRSTSNTDEAVLIEISGDLNRFVEPITNRIKANITWKRGPFVQGQSTWTIDVDEAVWLVSE